MPSSAMPRLSLPQILAYIAMGIVIILVGLPLIWMLFASFKLTDESLSYAGDVLPRTAHPNQLSRCLECSALWALFCQ
jgi:ABC-type glycerol-3-phosphate transport system permease component